MKLPGLLEFVLSLNICLQFFVQLSYQIKASVALPSSGLFLPWRVLFCPSSSWSWKTGPHWLHWLGPWTWHRWTHHWSHTALPRRVRPDRETVNITGAQNITARPNLYIYIYIYKYIYIYIYMIPTILGEGDLRKCKLHFRLFFRGGDLKNVILHFPFSTCQHLPKM